MAQSDSASDYGSEGWGFESLRAHPFAVTPSKRPGYVNVSAKPDVGWCCNDSSCLDLRIVVKPSMFAWLVGLRKATFVGHDDTWRRESGPLTMAPLDDWAPVLAAAGRHFVESGSLRVLA